MRFSVREVPAASWSLRNHVETSGRAVRVYPSTAAELAAAAGVDGGVVPAVLRTLSDRGTLLKEKRDRKAVYRAAAADSAD
jgi:ribosomal protein S25